MTRDILRIGSGLAALAVLTTARPSSSPAQSDSAAAPTATGATMIVDPTGRPLAAALEGRELRGLASYRVAQAGIGLVPEGRQIFPNLTVRENLVATAAHRGGFTSASALTVLPPAFRFMAWVRATSKALLQRFSASALRATARHSTG